MKLQSKYFTLDELIHTGTGLLNVPNQVQFDNLQKLVTNILDPLREMYGKPINVNSGFRSANVNKAVNGAKNSDHLFGFAADLKCENNYQLYNLILENFDFKQLISEKGSIIAPKWIHVSFDEKNNKKQILRIA